MRLKLKIDDKIRIYESPIVMGIVNCTPDSFYEGSRKQTEIEILSEVEKHISEGATIIDLGGYSTRPGVKEVSVKEELERIKKPLSWVSKQFPEVLISVDTFHSDIASFALENGVHIINDISAGSFDRKILDVVSKYQCPYIAMHLDGSIATMHDNPSRENILHDVFQYFNEKIEIFKNIGIEQIIIDPGFGFSKTMDDNFKLLNNLAELQTLGFPILVGLSRKTIIWQTLASSPNEALGGTIALNTVALLNGASILRVHDVKEAMDTIKLVERLAV